MEKRVYDLTVDPGLSKVAPPLADNEMDILRSDILERGCMTPIIVWDGVIVDGHNRYAICKENDIPFGIEEIKFSNMTEAKLWIIKAQIGRRNLLPFQRCEMIIPLEAEIQEDAENRRRQKISATKKGENMVQPIAPCLKTRDIMAAMAGVSHTTYCRAKFLAQKADEETLAKLRTEELKINPVFNKLMKPSAVEKPAKAVSPRSDEPIESRKALPEDASFTEKDEIAGDVFPTTKMESVKVEPAAPSEDFTSEDWDAEPSDFDEIKEQLDYAFNGFLSDLDYALEWFSEETATPENEKKVMSMIDDLMAKAKLAVNKKMEEQKHE